MRESFNSQPIQTISSSYKSTLSKLKDMANESSIYKNYELWYDSLRTLARNLHPLLNDGEKKEIKIYINKMNQAKNKYNASTNNSKGKLPHPKYTSDLYNALSDFEIFLTQIMHEQELLMG